VIQPLGVIVIEFLIKHYSELFDYTYTKNMEDELETVSHGEKVWYEICEKCYGQINALSESLLNEKKCNIQIDANNSYIIGKHGPVIKHEDSDGKITFKQVSSNIDISKLEKGEYKIEDIVELPTTNKVGKFQGCDLIVRKGKYGLYASWSENSKSLTCFGNRPVENITLDEVVAILEEQGEDKKVTPFVREITPVLSIRTGKYGDYIFYKTTSMKTPKFLKLAGFKEDYRNCPKVFLKEWIQKTYNISSV
jgi:DNA topoisomerase-1